MKHLVICLFLSFLIPNITDGNLKGRKFWTRIDITENDYVIKQANNKSYID